LAEIDSEEEDSEAPQRRSIFATGGAPFRLVAFLSCRGPVGANAISLAFLRGEAMGALLGHGFVFHGSGQGVVHVEFPARRGDTCMHACRYTKKTTKKRDKKRDTAGREGVGSSGKQSTA